ncbi:hypothetical protein PCE1_004017 [Barthelona sp. PCE]
MDFLDELLGDLKPTKAVKPIVAARQPVAVFDDFDDEDDFDDFNESESSFDDLLDVITKPAQRQFQPRKTNTAKVARSHQGSNHTYSPPQRTKSVPQKLVKNIDPMERWQALQKIVTFSEQHFNILNMRPMTKSEMHSQALMDLSVKHARTTTQEFQVDFNGQTEHLLKKNVGVQAPIMAVTDVSMSEVDERRKLDEFVHKVTAVVLNTLKSVGKLSNLSIINYAETADMTVANSTYDSQFAVVTRILNKSIVAVFDTATMITRREFHGTVTCIAFRGNFCVLGFEDGCVGLINTNHTFFGIDAMLVGMHTMRVEAVSFIDDETVLSCDQGSHVCKYILSDYAQSVLAGGEFGLQLAKSAFLLSILGKVRGMWGETIITDDSILVLNKRKVSLNQQCFPLDGGCIDGVNTAANNCILLYSQHRSMKYDMTRKQQIFTLEPVGNVPCIGLFENRDRYIHFTPISVYVYDASGNQITHMKFNGGQIVKSVIQVGSFFVLTGHDESLMKFTI